MTTGRRPAGAPEDWEGRGPAGVPKAQSGKGDGEDAGDVELLPDTGEKSTEGAETEPAEALDADLDALIADVKRERDEYLEIAQRARADFENYRKRAARESQEAERRGKASLAKELVPVVDNLERALRAAGIDPDSATGGNGEGPSEEVSAHEALARGVALVYADLRAALERAGLEAYDATGEPFDPNLHEALATRPAEDGAKPGVVLETLERGYRLDGQVLRAARVVVSG